MFPSVIHRSTYIASGPFNFAGSTSGTAGSNNGTGSAASFNNPTWIVGDGNGNFYISDTGNHTIRKVTSAGVVTTVFGTAGTSGSSLSNLNSPRGIALDASNNLYVADFSNNRVLFISNGSSSGSNMGTVSNVSQVAVNSNGSNLLAMSSTTSGKNLYQFRNGTLDGLINTVASVNGTTYAINSASITYKNTGTFYFSTTPSQFGNQIGMYRMQSFQSPTFVSLNITNISQPGGAGNVAYVQFSSSASGAGFATGQPFNFSGFTSSNWTASSGSYTDLVNYNATVVAVDQSAGSNLTFKYQPTSNYPVGTPNTTGTFSNDTYNSGSSYSNVLGIGWDSFIGAQTVGNLAPGDIFRMNFYFLDSNSIFPYLDPVNTPNSLAGTTLTLSGFTGIFATYNGSYSGTTYSNQVFDATTTNAARTEFSLGSTTGSSATQAYTSKTNSMMNLTGYILRGTDVPDGTLIISDSNPTGTSGTITLSTAITVPRSGTYYITSWPYSSSRVVQFLFPQVACPTGSYNSAPKPTPSPPVCTATIISNSLSGITLNGAPYGYSIANTQFSRSKTDVFYSSAIYGTGIIKYNISGDSGTTVDTNTATGSPSSFAILDTLPTTEMIALVPTPSSNNILRYAKSY